MTKISLHIDPVGAKCAKMICYCHQAMNTLDIGKITILPCADGCGVFYRKLSQVEPIVIQREAYENGWQIVEESKCKFLICNECAKKREGL